MKKMKRVICLIAAFVFCLSLCGCGALDEMRSLRATLTPEGNIRLASGAEYKLLPTCEELSPMYDEMKMVYLVESDVPLLLTYMMGEYIDLSDDGIFLQNIGEGDTASYCRTDVYDRIYERIVNGFTPEICCYWRYDFNADKLIPYILTDAQLDAVNQVCLTQKPQILPSAAYMSWEYSITLCMCSDDLLLVKEIVDICTVEGKYYVLDDSGVDTILYAVPQELAAVFADIMDAYIQAEDSYWSEW